MLLGTPLLRRDDSELRVMYFYYAGTDITRKCFNLCVLKVLFFSLKLLLSVFLSAIDKEVKRPKLFVPTFNKPYKSKDSIFKA